MNSRYPHSSMSQSGSALMIFLFGIVTSVATGGGGGSDSLSINFPDCIITTALQFNNVADAELNTVYASNEIRLPEFCDAPQVIDITSQGEYSINGSKWRQGLGEVRSGDRLRVRVTSASTFATTIAAVVRISEPTSTGRINNLINSSGSFRVTTQQGKAEDAPTALITFPVDQAVVNAQYLTVTGTANDSDGIHEVLINGLQANSSDGFNTWELRIRLVTGTNTITVETADQLLNRNPNAAQISIENTAIVLEDPHAIAIDEAGHRLLIIDDGLGAVVSADLSTSDLSILSEPSDGTELVAPSRITVNPARNEAWIFDLQYDDLMRLDLATGTRSLLQISGDPLEEVSDITVSGARNAIFALAGDLTLSGEDRSVIYIDMDSGNARVISDIDTPDDLNPFGAAWVIVFDDAGDRVIVLQDFGAGAMTVDPDTGARGVLADEENSLGGPRHAVVDQNLARVLVASRFDSIRSLDLTTGDVQELTSLPDEPAQIAYDSANSRLFILLRYSNAIAALDLITGNYSIVY
jgi:glucodextranase-like protein